MCNVYRMAAERIVNKKDWFACIAIKGSANILNKDPKPYIYKLEVMFKPSEVCVAWYSYEDENEFGFNTEKGRLGRTLMLLFMAEMEK